MTLKKVELKDTKTERENLEKRLKELKLLDLKDKIDDANLFNQEETGLTEDAKKVDHLLVESVGGGTMTLAFANSLRGVISVLIGEDIPHRKEYVLKTGKVIVLLNNANGHNYPLNVPVMVYSYPSRLCMSVNGVIGNTAPIAPTDVKGTYRIATKEEYEKFVSELSDVALTLIEKILV